MSISKLTPFDVFYPESDGKPMAETDVHRDRMVELIEAIRFHFRDDPQLYVSGNLFVYFEEGNPAKVVAPDFFAVRGVPGGRRRTYKVWKEGKPPAVTIELTSKSTHREDLVDKRAIYERIGVQEYFIFDPEGIRFDPQFRGFRLQGGRLEPVEGLLLSDGTQVFTCEVLGLELHGKGTEIRWVDPRTRERLIIPEEYAGALAREQRLRDQESQRAKAAEAEVARLKEELNRRGG
jgi:Uma2 family endonuclease